MNWMISTAGAVLLTTLTASIIFLIWYSIGKILEITGFINVLYMMLKVILLFWYVPVAFLAMLGRSRIRWGGLLFGKTKELEIGSGIFCIVWGMAVIILLGRYLLAAMGLGRKYRNAVPVDDEVYEYFEQVCEELKIPEGKIDLVNDYTAEVPYIGGLFRKYVVLPNAEYTMEQLRIIFLHELTHYRQGNHIMRHFTEIAFAFHFFNPIMWLFRRKVAYWGEYACDYEAIPRTIGYEYYFDMIRDISQTPTFLQKLVSGLLGTKDELEKRKKLIKRSYRYKMKSKLMAIVVAIGMIFASTLSVEAAMDAAGNEYMYAYTSTTPMALETSQDDYVEYSIPAFEEDVRIIYDMGPNINPLAITSFSWSMPVRSVRLSAAFEASAGQAIYVSATATPATSEFRLGIAEPNGYMRYINAQGAASHAFALTQTGSYAVFVQNMSDGRLTVVGSYNVE